MKKIILWNVVTLDGCFEGEGPWDLPFYDLVWGPELSAIILEQLLEADMLIFGKNTYLGMSGQDRAASYWHWVGGEKISARMNSMVKAVCSTTLEKTTWDNTTIIQDAVYELAQLKKQGDKPMYIFGSGKLSETLLSAGLIDEIRLCVVPIILGKGRRLLTPKIGAWHLDLLEARPLKDENGGIFLRYEVSDTYDPLDR